MSKTIIILISVLLLSRAWFIFSDEHNFIKSAWNKIGIDISKSYKTHPFYDEPEKIKWVAHDYGYLLSMTLLSGILMGKVSRRDKREYIAIAVFFYFSIFRVLEYCFFRFNIGLTAITFGIILFYLTLIYKKWQVL